MGPPNVPKHVLLIHIEMKEQLMEFFLLVVTNVNLTLNLVKNMFESYGNKLFIFFSPNEFDQIIK